jgi:CHAT domain-containing protein
MTRPQPRSFRRVCRTITLASLAVILASLPRAIGQAPAAPKSSPPLTAQQQERLKKRDPLGKQAKELKAQGKLPEAIKAAEAVLEIEREVLGETSDDAIGSLELLAQLHQDCEDWEKAKKARGEVLDLRTKMLPKDPWKVIDAQWALADVESLSKMDAAKRRRLAEADKIDHKSEDLYVQGKYRELEKAARQSAAIRKEIQGENHPAYAGSLENIGGALEKLGQYAEARSLAEQAVAIRKKTFGERHPTYADSMNTLGLMLQNQGDLAGARRLYENALSIAKESVGERNPVYFYTLWDLGELLAEQGDLVNARRLDERAVALLKEVLGERHPNYTLLIGYVAMLLHAQGDFAGARLLFERSLALRKELQGERHSLYPYQLNKFAMLLQSQGDLIGARRVLERALDLYKDGLGVRHPYYAACLNNLARVLLEQGDLIASQPLCEQALALRKEVLGEGHPEYAASLETLSVLLREKGDLAGARPLLEQALAVHKVVVGEGHPDYSLCLINLAGLHQAQGNIPQARRLAEQANDYTQEFLTKTLPTLTEGERVELLAQAQFILAASLSLTAGVSELDPAAYRRLLFWKGLAGAGVAARRLSAAPPEIRTKLMELDQVRGQLNRVTYAVVDPKGRVQHDRQLTELRERRERLETELLRTIAWKPDAPEPGPVAELLPSRATLVDLFRYLHTSPTADGKGSLRREARYVAFVVRKGKPPHRIELGPAAEIDRAIDSWRAESRNDAAHPTSIHLASLVWQPLAADLDGAALVLVAPDGQFNFLPWGALPDLKEPGAYLIERLAFAAVDTGRQVVELAKHSFQPAPERLLAVGGVDYNRRAPAGAPQLAAAPAAAGGAGASTFRGAVFTGDKPPSFPELPGTLPEANAIAELFRDATGGATQVVSRSQASKEQVCGALPGHRYIHLATHGYFAPESVKAYDPFNLDALSLESAGRIGQVEVLGFYPSLLAGLAWAGANVPVRDPITGALDIGAGVMTAEEVEGVDLAGCELAVLSACDTGRGKVAGGQGVMGLQRAFHQAGARTVVANMWPVDDAATRKLMTLFYTNLWGERHRPPTEALRQAQLTVLNEAVGDGVLPRYWAGWVLSGDPGSAAR